MRLRFLFSWLIIATAFISCDNHVTLSPKLSRFIMSVHLHKIDGSEQISQNLRAYIRNEQKLKRKIASASNLDSAFSPENNPKFPLPYYLVPEKKSNFLLPETSDAQILDELSLRITGIKHYKFFVHPAHEKEFYYLRRFYDYIGPDMTEFLATPTTDNYTLVVWNKNNPKRKPFIAKLDLQNPEKGVKPNSQIIQEVPIKIADEKNK